MEAELGSRWAMGSRGEERPSPRAWSSADCDALTAAVTDKGHHDLFKDIQLASRIIRLQRSQVFNAGVGVTPQATRAAGVSEHHSSHSNAGVFFAPLFLMTELQMALFSATR